MMNAPEAGDSLTPPSGDGGMNIATVPMDLLPGCKAGDMYKVASVDQGSVQLEHQPGPGADDMDSYKAEAKAAVPME